MKAGGARNPPYPPLEKGGTGAPGRRGTECPGKEGFGRKNSRLKVLNVSVDPVDMDQAIDRIEHFLSSERRPHSVFAVNPEKSCLMSRDPSFCRAFSTADMLIPDGVGIVLAARILHGVYLHRVTGIDLMKKLCCYASERGRKVFVYGSTEEVNKKAVERLRLRYPGLQVAGRADGYTTSHQMSDLLDKINGSGAEILFLALGSPKQEKWYLSHAGKLENVRICQGVGGSLDAIAGNVKRAPKLWRILGMEWLFRLISEPARFRRQKSLLLFAIRVFAAKLGG
jgi:N-acetylglucosaminyldiphosphoundecaprenol N-acetyl-beta-D-mannosaminyltransferase